jgi:hypothetical protein
MNVVEDLLKTLKFYVEIAQRNDGTFQCNTAKSIMVDLCKLIPNILAFDAMNNKDALKDIELLNTQPKDFVFTANLVNKSKKGWPKGKKRK